MRIDTRTYPLYPTLHNLQPFTNPLLCVFAACGDDPEEGESTFTIELEQTQLKLPLVRFSYDVRYVLAIIDTNTPSMITPKITLLTFLIL